jgi:hypothetical protein
MVSEELAKEGQFISSLHTISSGIMRMPTVEGGDAKHGGE